MSRRVSGGGGTRNSSIMAVERIMNKEGQYREAIAKNHAFSMMTGEVISIQGDLENSMVQAATDDATKEAIQASIQEQRERLKKISEKNVQNTRDVDAFMHALQGVKGQIQATPDNGDMPDYTVDIKKHVADYRSSQSGRMLDVRDEQMCRDIRSRLGEKEQAGEDEDLEVLRNPSGGAESLKCPYTARLYEDPLKNKVCGHIYSRAGIQHSLRNRHSTRCPVAGCTNHNVTMSQLEEDEVMALQVKRYKRREDAEKQIRASQALDESSDEEVL